MLHPTTGDEIDGHERLYLIRRFWSVFVDARHERGYRSFAAARERRHLCLSSLAFLAIFALGINLDMQRGADFPLHATMPWRYLAGLTCMTVLVQAGLFDYLYPIKWLRGWLLSIDLQSVSLVVVVTTCHTAISLHYIWYSNQSDNIYNFAIFILLGFVASPASVKISYCLAMFALLQGLVVHLVFLNSAFEVLQIALLIWFLVYLIGCLLVHNRHRLTRYDYGLLLRLSDEMAQRKQVEKILRQYREVLEQRVSLQHRELQQSEQQLIQAQKMDAVGHLAGGIAHDFNNVLTIIQGYVDLSKGSEDFEEIYEFQEQIEQAAFRAGSLSRELMSFSRGNDMSRDVVDLVLLIENLKKLIRPMIPEHIELQLELGDDEVPVRVNSSQIEQVLLNLIINARDAMPKGGELILKLRRAGLEESCMLVESLTLVECRHCVVLEISDTGVGIAAERLEAIFEPFHTSKAVGDGAGLGLAVVRGIVDGHGGSISVVSTMGEGSCFKLVLRGE